MKVLLTGGAGFIGSHTAVALASAGHEPVLFDNFSNARREVIVSLGDILGAPPELVEGDIRDPAALDRALEGVDAVVHFAALKSVGDSIAAPLDYHANNVGGLLVLLDAMRRRGIARLVFSSSATVYGEPRALPIAEDHPLAVLNPYGRTKLVGEQVLADLAAAPDADWSIAVLRYFNPIGAHSSGRIGEAPADAPTNVMPLIIRAALGQGDLSIFGDDYDTPDGTAIRDYLHVMDLAEGHVAALERLGPGLPGFTVNLGTGEGTSVRQLVDAFERVTGQSVPVRLAPRRAGDAAAVFAAVDRAQELLGWRTRRDLATMCADAWRFASTDPSR